MVEALRAHLERSGLIPNGARVLVGYSGGADSTCLLVLLHELGYELVAAHLDHAQRPESEAEAEHCAEFARRLGVPFVLERIDVPMLARSMKVGIEDAGRVARYALFERAAKEHECACVATAHTRDDLVETILWNLVRGAGLRGLAGIPPVRGAIVRPLLPFARSQTRQYCQERGLWFHDDPTNQDPRFARTRLRTEVVPSLRSLNPKFDEAIAALAEVAREEDALLDDLASAHLADVAHRPTGPFAPLADRVVVEMHRPNLSNLPLALRRRVVRLATRRLAGTLGFDQTEALISGLRCEPKGCVTTGDGAVAVSWTPERVVAVSRIRLVPFDVALAVPGKTVLPHGWMGVRVEIVPARAKSMPEDGLCVELDRSAVSGALCVRSPRPGDRWEPTTGRQQRILESLRSHGVPLPCRKIVPIIWDSRGPVAIPGVGTAARARLGPEAIEALWVCLEFS